MVVIFLIMELILVACSGSSGARLAHEYQELAKENICMVGG